MADLNNAYLLLGIQPGASEREIRRAYRRVVVNTHRSGVLNLVDRLKELSRAYESLKDPLHHKGVRDAIAESQQASVWSPPRSPVATAIRSEATREVQRLSERVGAKAQSENAPVVEELVTESTSAKPLQGAPYSGASVETWPFECCGSPYWRGSL